MKHYLVAAVAALALSGCAVMGGDNKPGFTIEDVQAWSYAICGVVPVAEAVIAIYVPPDDTTAKVEATARLLCAVLSPRRPPD